MCLRLFPMRDSALQYLQTDIGPDGYCILQCISSNFLHPISVIWHVSCPMSRVKNISVCSERASSSISHVNWRVKESHCLSIGRLSFLKKVQRSYRWWPAHGPRRRSGRTWLATSVTASSVKHLSETSESAGSTRHVPCWGEWGGGEGVAD